MVLSLRRVPGAHSSAAFRLLHVSHRSAVVWKYHRHQYADPARTGPCKQLRVQLGISFQYTARQGHVPTFADTGPACATAPDLKRRCRSQRVTTAAKMLPPLSPS
jgi:hypothetical protein